MSRAAVVELLGYVDWATGKLYASLAHLTDTHLDQPFEIGPGSVRKTLTHLRAAERVWLERWRGNGNVQFAGLETALPLAELHEQVHQLAEERNSWVDQLDDRTLSAPITFTLRNGDTFTFPLIDLILHVCNHHVHHRAQILNMFRHLGLKPAWLDLLAMKREQTQLPPMSADKTIIARLYAYSDWAMKNLIEAARALSNDELNKPFEMGMGTLKKTLIHNYHAERWWLTNWTEGPGQMFPDANEEFSLAELEDLYSNTSRPRDVYLAERSLADLKRPMEALVRPGKSVSFPLADVMVHLTFHATHHRAQANNMLRRLGKKPLGLDLVLWLKEGN